METCPCIAHVLYTSAQLSSTVIYTIFLVLAFVFLSLCNRALNYASVIEFSIKYLLVKVRTIHANALTENISCNDL